MPANGIALASLSKERRLIVMIYLLLTEAFNDHEKKNESAWRK